jgi:hypothetical protein
MKPMEIRRADIFVERPYKSFRAARMVGLEEFAYPLTVAGLKIELSDG